MQAENPPLDLSGPLFKDDIAGSIDYFLDADGLLTIDDVASSKSAELFAPVGPGSPDFGYTSAKVWLRFEVKNTSIETRDWLILFKENFMQEFDVYQIGQTGDVALLMSESPLSAFSSRPVSYPLLVAPFELDPGEHATFFVRYRSGGSTGLSFSIQTVQSFTEYADGRTALHFTFYGMMTVLALVGLVAFIISRNPVFAAYTGYTTAALLFVMHGDGNGFKYLWPNAPLFNGSASMVTGASWIIFGAVFSNLFLQTRRYHPVLFRLLSGVVMISLALLASAFFVDTQLLKKVFVLLSSFAVVLFVFAGLVAARTRFRQVRFYVLAWSGAAISSAILTGQHWLGLDLSDDFQLDSMRAVMVFDALFMGLALWDYFNQMRHSRHQALRASLHHAERNLELNRRLEDLEQGYEMAQKMAAAQGERLTNTIHDLSQPLHALRLNVRALAGGGAPSADVGARIEDTFSYLENLVSDHMQRSVLGGGVPNTPAKPSPVEIGEVLSGIRDMFVTEAGDKCLDFRFVGTSSKADAAPLALMRVVSNLVSNAIKYADTGKVLLGCRREKNGVRIEVHDQGPGMSATQFAKARERAERLSRDANNRPGFGLGLDIALALAEENGWKLSHVPHAGPGVGFSLFLPTNAAVHAQR